MGHSGSQEDAADCAEHGRYIEGALADGSAAKDRPALGEGPLGEWNSLTIFFSSFPERQSLKFETSD